MAKPVRLQDSFDAGVRQDNGRDDMPKGALWWAEDMIPRTGARLRERGGWENFSDDIAATTATASRVQSGIFAGYDAGAVNVVLDEDGRVYKIASNGAVTDAGAGGAGISFHKPAFHRDMVIFPGNPPKKVTNAAGTLTVANLGGSPPAASFVGVFNDRTVLARSSSTVAQYRRMWFSDPGDPEGWDTTNSFWDFTYPIMGFATLKSGLLVFHEAYTSRLRGTTPPPGSDFFADDPLFSVGCGDARSIAYWNDRVLFASPEGIHITDGAAVVDVTARCGMGKYWQETLASWSSTWTITGEVLRENYFVCVLDGATLKAAAMIDLNRMAYWPLTNIDAISMWAGQGGADELYFGRYGAARVATLSSILMPAAGVKNDGDGDAVTGLIETPFYRGEPTMKGWRRLFTTHHLEDYATDNPTVAVAYVTTPEATSYTNFATTLSETTAEERKIIPMGLSARGIGLRYTRANAGDWRLNHLEADVHQREGSR